MKEFDFDSVGKRMPYALPEGFFEQAKREAVTIATRGEQQRRPLFFKVAIAAAVVLAVCGAAVWFENFNSPENRYERMLAELSSEVLWEYACEYDTIADGEYLY